MIEKYKERISGMIAGKRELIRSALPSAERNKVIEDLQALEYCEGILKARINEAKRAEKGMFI